MYGNKIPSNDLVPLAKTYTSLTHNTVSHSLSIKRQAFRVDTHYLVLKNGACNFHKNKCAPILWKNRGHVIIERCIISQSF